jgi:sigma-B regulation protein RsbU (phosphoserine phosphatase)
MAFNILSIDDEMDMQDLLKQKFRRQIRNDELNFFYANNGKEGLSELQKHPEIEMALVDINMPIMDGLTFLAEVSKLNIPAFKVVIISAYGDMKNIRLAMNRGAFDFINKPIDFTDLEATIDKTRERVSFLKEQQKEIKRLTVIENELIAAAQIQSSLLPIINGKIDNYEQVDIGSFFKPAHQVGGDFYDVFRIDKSHLGFVIADVSGKGISAAAFMLLSHTAINIFAHQNNSVSKVLNLANNYLCKDNKESMFTTTFFGILNVDTGDFTYSNGGHIPPFIISENKIHELAVTNNPALGVIDDVSYNEITINLNKGDSILMFTDGVTEAQNLDNIEFGESRIKDVISNNTNANPAELCSLLFKTLENYRGEAVQFDDITLLSFKWK